MQFYDIIIYMETLKYEEDTTREIGERNYSDHNSFIIKEKREEYLEQYTPSKEGERVLSVLEILNNIDTAVEKLGASADESPATITNLVKLLHDFQEINNSFEKQEIDVTRFEDKAVYSELLDLKHKIERGFGLDSEKINIYSFLSKLKASSLERSKKGDIFSDSDWSRYINKKSEVVIIEDKLKSLKEQINHLEKLLQEQLREEKKRLSTFGKKFFNKKNRQLLDGVGLALSEGLMLPKSDGLNGDILLHIEEYNYTFSRIVENQKKMVELEGELEPRRETISSQDKETKLYIKEYIKSWHNYYNKKADLDKKEFVNNAIFKNLVLLGLHIGSDSFREENLTSFEKGLPKVEFHTSLRNIQDAMERYFSFATQTTGNSLEMVFADFIKRFDRVKENTSVSLNINEEKLKSVFDAGKVKSIFELDEKGVADNAKGGFFSDVKDYLYRRRKIEKDLGLDYKNPISSALSSDSSFDKKLGPAHSYGDIVVLFKDKVLERSRFVLGDSMNTSQHSLIEPFRRHGGDTRFNDPKGKSLFRDHALIAKTAFDHYFDNFKARDPGTGRSGEVSLQYIESLVVGGLSLEDIKSIKVTKKLISTELEDMIKKNNIPLEYS